MPKHNRDGQGGRPGPRRASRAAGRAADRRAGAPPSSEADASRQSLARLLETPHLAHVVPHLSPEALHRLIRHHGLDVCAEIVASATPTQLAAICDLDLWRSSRPGQDERFDIVRFREWLELLVDAGGSVAARTMAAMDEDLVVAGLSRHIRVFDPAAIVPIVDGEPVDVDPGSHRGPECEVGGYLVRGANADGWDAIVAMLVALEGESHDRFHAVMRRCRRLSCSAPEVDGLDHLLMAPEQALHDVALDREHRRSRQGYGTPADARAFLLMARRPRPRGASPINPIVAAYFRTVTDASASENRAIRNPHDVDGRVAPLSGVADAVVALRTLADVAAPRPRALLESGDAQPRCFARLRTLMQCACDHDENAYLTRTRELAFLANTLAAGCSIQARSFTRQEAADAAAAVCNLGLEQWLAPATAGADRQLPDTFLTGHDLVAAFEVGWAVLHEHVSMFVTEQLLVALSDLQCSDADVQEGLDRLRIELTRQRETGTPWHARDALDVLATLDVPAWVGVLGLLDECPVIPAALTATLERRTGAISATDFEFISTRSQLGKVRAFMARFPDILFR